MSNQIEIFDPPEHPALAPSYSQISIVPLSPTTKMISLAGQVGHDYTNPQHPVSTSFINQVRIALCNVEICLSAAGATKRDIVSNRQYVVRMSQMSAEDFKARSDMVVEWFGKDRDGLKPPPDTLIGVESLAQTGGKGEYLIEMEVVAIVHSKPSA